jgi:N-acetylmuramoyl-L-alanine amidase
MKGRIAAVLVCLALAALPLAAHAQGIATPVERLSDQIFVAGREVWFEHLGISRGEPVARVDDGGLASLLHILGAKMQYQPGTRFVVFTRADGTLITFTVGSNAVSVDDISTAIPFGPFYENGEMYMPLLALSRALGLYERRFRGGYAFAPQIISVQRRVGQHRTVIEIQATAPLAWRSTYGGSAKHPTFIVTFPGFANAAGRVIDLGGREARTLVIQRFGPPGFPITNMSIDLMHGIKLAAHRTGAASLDLVLARSERDLALNAVLATPSVQVSPRPKPAPTIVPTAAPTPEPTIAPQVSASVPTAVPAPEVTDNSTAMPGASPSPAASGASPSPSPSPLEKIMDVSVIDTADASRITLSLTGPVSFEWHRLADPDNRFWIDISQAALIGPAREIAVKLATVRSVKISQHQILPDHVVRLIIDPSQPVDVSIGAIEGSPNLLGIDIHARPPPADAPSSGVGLLPAITQLPQPRVAITAGHPHPNVIVIDPGHGGNDPGAINQQLGLIESHLNLAIAQRLKTDLERDGWHVVMTRDGDYEVGDPNGNDDQELQARCDIANAAGARLFISVQVNSSVSRTPSGLTTYFWRSSDRALAQTIQNAITRASGAGDAGVKRANYYVIHHTVMPSVLIENAYLSNWHDAALLAQPAFLDRLAAGIAQGVKDYTGGPPAP